MESPSPATPPLTQAMQLILMSLLAGDRHGYAIMLEIEALTEGAVRVGPATLYTSIKKMLDARLIEQSGERPDALIDDERRRYYRLTSTGRAGVAAETRRLEKLVRYASPLLRMGAA